MKLSSLLLAGLVLGCGGSGKKVASPPPGGDVTGGEATGDAVASGDVTKPEATKPVAPEPPDTGGYVLAVPASRTYAPLNPDAPGPEVAPVHGDLKSATAFFVKVAPGGKAPLHTHSSDYHAVVISGAPKHWIGNAAKTAKPLTPGSYFFQPANQPHVDECTGTEPCVLFVTMAGAFDFTPVAKAKKEPAGKYVQIERAKAKLAPLDPSKPDGLKVAVLSGDMKTGPVAMLLEVPPGTNSGLHGHSSSYEAVVVDGAPAHWLPHEKDEGKALEAGAYWFQPATYEHGDRCTGSAPCHVVVFMEKGFDFIPPKKS